MTARQELQELHLSGKPYEVALEELAALQIAAADEAFQAHRVQVSVLDRRARQVGIDQIRTLDDIVPLLFSHTTYKSYPLTFFTGGKWNLLLKWYDTLAGQSVADVDVSDVTDIDGFVAALRAAGHITYVTSGTSGKCSLLNLSQPDLALTER